MSLASAKEIRSLLKQELPAKAFERQPHRGVLAAWVDTLPLPYATERPGLSGRRKESRPGARRGDTSYSSPAQRLPASRIGCATR